MACAQWVQHLKHLCKCYVSSMTRRWRCGAACKLLNLWVVDTGNEFLSPDKRSHSVLQKTRRVMLSGENLFKHLFKANHLSQIMLKIKKPGRFWHFFEASITGFDTFISQWLQIWSCFDSEYSYKTTKNKRNTFFNYKISKKL